MDILEIPPNTEWCFMRSRGDKNIVLDLSKCNKLIGVYLDDIDEIQIIWPVDEEYIIPFICIGTSHGDKQKLWENKIRYRQLNVKYVCFVTCGGAFSKMQGPQWRLDKNVGITTVNINKRISDSDEKCLVLDEESCDELLLDKILEYAVKEESIRYNMKERFERWWNLYYGLWIKREYWMKG